jgi:hypothetical protein
MHTPDATRRGNAKPWPFNVIASSLRNDGHGYLPGTGPASARSHVFVMSPLPLREIDAHICPKPAPTPATTAGRLRHVNAAARKPNEDAVTVPTGLSGRLREVSDEY